MRGNILLIEDEQKISRVLELELRHEQFQVVLAQNGPDGLALARDGGWDVILLDVMLPGMDGLDVLRHIRDFDPEVPVLLLTARDAVADKVSGLDLGANDYITKPFAIEELMARIRSAMRVHRNQTDNEELYRVADLAIDASSRTVTRAGKPIELTPREFDLLLFLTRHAGTVKSREQILADVWGYHFAGDTNLVDVYIRYLRQKIDQGAKTKLIVTSRGVGYAIKAPSKDRPSS